MANLSMEELARELGVSKGLVSLALSGKYGVNEDTRSKIILYAIQNNYDFSRCKINKDSKANNSRIVVLLNQKDLLAERFWPQILKGIESELYNHSVKMKVAVWNDEVDCEKAVLDLAVSQCSGIIILNELPQKALDEITRMGFSITIVDGRRMYESQFDTVRANNYAGGYTGAKYLVEKGHKNLLFVGYSDFSRSFKERYHGFVDCIEAMQNPEIQVTQAISAGAGAATPNGDLFDYIYNKEELLRHFENMQTAPTAVICANDPIALEVIQQLQGIGYTVPDDVSVLGFDNIKDSEYCSPKLTTIHVPKGEMGKIAVRVLMNRILQKDKMIESIALDVTLVERDSVRSLS